MRTSATPLPRPPPQGGKEATVRVAHLAATHDFGWDGVEQLPYKEDERALYKTITRQVLFSDPNMAGELRYFAVAPGGFSTLERHEHMHGVLILRWPRHAREAEAVTSRARASPARQATTP